MSNKGPGYGVVEGSPTMAVKIAESFRRRSLLTASAFVRGKALAEEVKPLLREQTDIVVQVVNIEQALKHQQTLTILNEETQAYRDRLEAAIKMANENAVGQKAYEF